MNRLAMVVLLLIGVLLLSGCAQQAPPAAPQTQYVCGDGKTIVADVSLCPPAAASAGAPAQAAAAAAITPDIELEVCSGMPSMPQSQTSLEELCITGLAAKHNNVSLCKKLSYDGRRTCYLVAATAAGDAAVCAGAGSDKDSCYQQYAYNANEPSVCEKISDINNKDSCYSNIVSKSGEPALCDKIRSLGQKNGCYWNVAMRLQDSSYCEKITEESQKQNCLQNLQPSRAPGVPLGK